MTRIPLLVAVAALAVVGSSHCAYAQVNQGNPLANFPNISAPSTDVFSNLKGTLPTSATTPLSGLYVKGFVQHTAIEHDLGLFNAGVPLATVQGLGAQKLAFGGGAGYDLVFRPTGLLSNPNQVPTMFVGAFVSYTLEQTDWKASLGTASIVMPMGNRWGYGARAGLQSANGTKFYGLFGQTLSKAQPLTIVNPMLAQSFAVHDWKGWTYGTGMEMPLSANGNVFLGVELTRTDFGSNPPAFMLPAPLVLKTETTENVGRVALGFRF